MRAVRRAALIARGLAAILTLAGITAGLPLALYRFGGSPIPARLPSAHQVFYVLSHQDNGSLFLAAVRDISWLAWAAFTVAVLTEAQAALRGRRAPRLHLAGLQGAAGRLVALASLTFSAPAIVTLVASPAMAATARPSSTIRLAATEHASTARPAGHAEAAERTTAEAAERTAGAAHASAAHPAAAHRTIVVRLGDCLWTIAQRYLGSGERYKEIVHLNLGHTMDDGQVFSDPSRILPGWHLQLPDTMAAAPVTTGQEPTAGSGHVAGSGHAAGSGRSAGTVARHDGHPSADPRFWQSHSSASPVRPSAAGNASGQAGIGNPEAAGSGATPTASVSGQHSSTRQAALFTLGMLAGGALASLERLRHKQRQYRRPGRRIALPSDEASVRFEQRLRAAPPPTPPPASLREALHDLGEGIATAGEALPPIVGIHLSAGSLDVLLSAPAVAPPPEPFTITPARQAMSWTVELDDPGPDPATLLPAPGEVGDLLPGLFTAGVTEGGGYLLLDLEAMRVTCCDGPDDLTDRLLVTAATELAASRWSGWYELLLVGCDELEVLGRAELCADLDDALDLMDSRAQTIARRLRDDSQADVRTRRLEDPEDEDWGLILLVSRTAPTTAQMTRLLDLADGPGGIAALVAGDTQADDGKLAPAVFQLAPDPDYPGEIVATVTLAYLGPQHQITVWPQTLTVSDYEALAGIFATAARTDDVGQDEAPYDEYGGPPWIRLAAAPVAPVAAEFAGLADEEFARPLGRPEPADRPDRPDRPGRPERSGQSDRPGQSDRSGQSDRPGLAWGEPFDGEQPEPHEFAWDSWLRDGRDAPAWRVPGPEQGEPEQDEQEQDVDEQSETRLAQVRPIPSAHWATAGSWRHQGQPANGHSPRGIEVKVLGSLEVTGTTEPLAAKQAELLLALALHAPVGLSSSGLAAMLGADADHPRPADAVRQLITRTRRRLGQAPDGQEYIIHLGSGIYVLHEDARLDWTAFSALARRGRADRHSGDLRAAMAMVRGQPLRDCYHWWIDVGLIETIRAEIVDTAELLAQLEIAAGNPQAARRAARGGLAAEATAEQLWRALMCAEHDAGNPAGVTDAWTGCLDAITEIAPGGEPHPDTEHLFRRLTRGAVSAALR